MSQTVNAALAAGTLDHCVTNFLLGGARYQLATRQGDAGFRVAWAVNTGSYPNPVDDLARPFLWMGPGEPVETASLVDEVVFRRPGVTMRVIKVRDGVGLAQLEAEHTVSLSFGPPAVHHGYGFVCDYEATLYYPDPLTEENIGVDAPARRYWTHGKEYYLCVQWGAEARVASTMAGLRLEFPAGTHTVGFAMRPELAAAGAAAQEAQAQSCAAVEATVTTAWQELLTHVPLPEEPAYREKALETWYFLARAAHTEPYGVVKRRVLACAPMGYQAQVFHWDSMFAMQAMDLYDPAWAREILRALFDYWQPGHPVNGCYSTAREPGPDTTQLPLQAWTVLRHQLRWGDTDFLREVYPILHDDLWWWFTQRDLYGTGLPVTESCGYDNAVVFDTLRKASWSMDLRTPLMAPDVTALLTREARAFALLADLLGYTDDAAQARQWATRARRAARELLWDADDQLLYYHDGTAQRKVSGVYNLIGAPLLTQADAAAMLGRYVVPGSPFWPGLFGATAASDAPGYDPNQFWRGPVWGGPVWLCAEMFSLAGFPEVARTAARPFLDAVARQPAFYEHYHPETGKGQRIPMLLGLTAAPFMLLAMEDYLAAAAYQQVREDRLAG